jgi:hypothetical protein
MCDGEYGCQCGVPVKKTVRPEECTPEKVRECHGDVEEHPCTGSEKD